MSHAIRSPLQILVVGVRQKNAPIATRERFALSPAEMPLALARLAEEPGVEECAILSTCNRTELYLVVRDALVGREAFQRFFHDWRGVSAEAIGKALFMRLEEDAALHLMRVASGLDSLILGESQILGQVKDAYESGKAAGTTGRLLNRLFKVAISASKRVRSDLGIADKDLSVSRAAYECARARVPDLLDRPVVVMGGGKVAALVLQALRRDMTDTQAAGVTIVNRSEARLAELVAETGFRGVGWDQVQTALCGAHVVFVATGAPHLVLEAAHLETLAPQERPALILDLSTPRNADPHIAERFAAITLLNTDDLDGVHALSQERQRALAEAAQALIGDAYAGFARWRLGLYATPTITGLRGHLESLRQEQLDALAPVHHAFADTLSRRLVNRILHEPMARLREGDSPQAVQRRAAVIRHVFNLQASGS